MAQKFLHASQVEVDSLGRVNTGPLATDAKLDDILAAQIGTGLPVPLIFADPGNNAYAAAQDAPRAAARMRVIVGDSGVVISLDGGITDSITLKPNMADDIPLNIPADTSITVKRYTAGTAFTGLVMEIR